MFGLVNKLKGKLRSTLEQLNTNSISNEHLTNLFSSISVILVLVTIIFGVARCRNREYMNPEWIDPHDWSLGKESLQICPKCERTARPEYLRLINSIFNPSQFRVCQPPKFIWFGQI